MIQSGLKDDAATSNQRRTTFGTNDPIVKIEKTLWEMVNL